MARLLYILGAALVVMSLAIPFWIRFSAYSTAPIPFDLNVLLLEFAQGAIGSASGLFLVGVGAVISRLDQLIERRDAGEP